MDRRVLLVLGRPGDPAARALVDRWSAAGEDASLMAPGDLSVAGWRHRPEDPAADVVVASGRLLPARRVAGVVIRLFHVAPEDLPHIAAEDRAFAAAEMTAFLRSWLASLTCPVLNPPTDMCLAGPCWRPEQWMRTAARLGIAVATRDRRIRFPAVPEATAGPAPRGDLAFTVVGKRAFGEGDQALAAQAVRLAEATGAGWLSVRFQSPEREAAFAGADLLPEVTDTVADAVLDWLRLRQGKVDA